MALSSDAHILLEHYQNLLELCRKLELLSAELFEEISDKSHIDAIQQKLKEKMEIVKAVQEESRVISELKREIYLSENEKTNIRSKEVELSEIFGKVIEREDMNKTLLEKQGVRVARR
jgi:hypothetical protein